MKNKLFICALPLLLVGCYQQERNCANFRTGTFVFEQEINGEKHTSTFVRTAEYDIESYNGKPVTAIIRWFNVCDYILRKIHPKKMTETKAVHMKMLTTNDDSHLFEYNFVGDVNKQKG